jgi:hypothetical protein
MDVDSRGVSLDMLRFRDVPTFEVRFLEPSQIRLFRTPGSSQIRMTIEGERSILRVHVVRCFPLSDPNHSSACATAWTKRWVSSNLCMV